MEENQKKKLTGTYKYDRDTKRCHRFLFEGDDNMKGAIYLPKSVESIPDEIILLKEKTLERVE